MTWTTIVGAGDGFGLTERHRSRTCLASGYDAVLVSKFTESCPDGTDSAQLGVVRFRSLQVTSAR
jgi:hypothetical protein